MELSSLTSLWTTVSVLAVAIIIGMGYSNKQHDVKTDESITTYRCLQKQFVPMILSTDPLLIHIDEFVTAFEAEYLISLASDTPLSGDFCDGPGREHLANSHCPRKFEPSTVGYPDITTNTTIRRSYSAVLPDVLDKNVSDPVIECVLQRASAFQGHVPLDYTETLQLVRYQAGEYYREHYDAWKGNDPEVQGNRETSFFVILRSEGLLHGSEEERQDVAPGEAKATAGTSFPRLRRRFEDKRLCEVIECGEGVEGIVAKPLARIALFWENLREDGTIHPGSLHQGLELPQGKAEKIGMNIWTWNRPYLG